MAKKKTPKIRHKTVTAERPTRKNHTKSTICYGDFRKNVNFEKNRKKYDLLGQLSQKIENYMSRFCTLLALGSTNVPVVLRISP